MSLGDFLIPIATFASGIGGTWLLKPHTQAEARRADAEARSLDWARFEKEIERLDRQIADLRRDRADADVAADKREAENKSLRAELTRLKGRIKLLEELVSQISVDPNTPADMLAQIEKLKNHP